MQEEEEEIMGQEILDVRCSSTKQDFFKFFSL